MTDYYETKEGFILEWKETLGAPTCGGIIGGSLKTSGTLTSPGWNGTTGGAIYENDLNCLWELNGAENMVWNLNITYFYLEEHASGGGCYDYLQIIDGQLLSDHTIYLQCGYQTNISMIATSGQFAKIRFRTDSSVGRTGFSLDYSTVPRVCGGTLTASTGNTQLNYNYDAFEGNSEIYRCSWLIQSTSMNRYVDLVTSTFDIPGLTVNNCREGWVEYRDYGTNAEVGQVHRYCSGDSNFVPPEFKSLGNTAQVLLRNAKNQNASFSIQVSQS